MKKQKRVNKDKAQIAREMAMEAKRKADQDKVRYIAQTAFPFVEKLKTVYDAQTVFSATAGYISTNLATEVSKIKLKNLNITLSKEKTDADLHKAVENIIKAMGDIAAEDVADVLEIMGRKLGDYVVNKGLKEKMTIKTSDFVAK